MPQFPDRFLHIPKATQRLLVLLFSLFAATFATAEPRHVRWVPDTDLEDQMSVLKEAGHYCLPPPYPLDFDPYVTKLVSSLYDNCVTDNMSADQIQKYAVYAAASMTPAAAYSVPYAVSELKSDAMKCVLKSFVGASDLTAAQKAAYNADVDDIATIKDWAKFTYGASKLSAASADALGAAMTQSGLSAVDRSQDTGLFSRAYATVAGGRTMRFIKELWWDEWIVALDEYEYNLEQCRFEDARRAVARSMEMADQDCKAVGHSFRSYESQLRSGIHRTYKTLDRDLIGDAPATILIVNDLNRIKRNYEQAGRTLREYVKIFAEIEQLQDQDLVDNIRAFEQGRDAYETYYRTALEGLSTPRACHALDDLDRGITKVMASLNRSSYSCREAMFGGSDGLDRLSPRTLRSELIHVARERSADWWVKMDQIWASMNACALKDAESLRRQLLTEMANNPIYRIVDGVCDKQEQTPLIAALDTLTAPARCAPAEGPDEIAVPDLRGKSVAQAAQALAEFGDHFVLGEAQPALERPNGVKVGHVVYTKPAAKVLVPPGTKITLFLYAPL